MSPSPIRWLCLPPAFKLVSYLSSSPTLKVEAKHSSEISVDFQRITRRYVLEDRTFHNHRCENLKSYIPKLLKFHGKAISCDVLNLNFVVKTRKIMELFCLKQKDKYFVND
jgi:hypothetical protein